MTAAAGTGIGSAVARKAIEEGATVLISDFHERRLGETADRLGEETGTRPDTQVCNVTDEDAGAGPGRRRGRPPRPHRRDDQQRRPRRHGRRGGHDRRAVVDGLDVTLTGTFRCTRAVLTPDVRAGPSGVIVNNASVLGWRAQEEQAHYAAAKAGVMALTRCAAIEAAPHGVRINAVAPEPRHAPVPGQGHHRRAARAELTEREAFGRYAEPWEIANVMVFLASDYSSYMTGEIISVSSQRP